MHVKFLSLSMILLFVLIQSRAQYIERPDVKYFEGKWIALEQEYDSILLDMKYKLRFPVTTEECDTCILTDVLLMDLRCYTDGELVYRVENLEKKYKQQYFVAVMAKSLGPDHVEFRFRYADDKNTSDSGKGLGTLRIKSGIMQMEIDPEELLEFKSPDGDENKKDEFWSPISIPRNLFFVKKTIVMLL